ncbi:Leucine-rich repeat typical subtype [Penicillium riverlandense]|uniref:Leucine-rich repeat typical subtype n=1 Tax=Penicillium riverlandense TaxID=1903569 RepID=UPI002546EEF7|nr:Leucine-rich repeat typical subtype [Penicillium riverlandense]KAJ5806995.1 Leucine-rich repeat typical subtype [Penicillium riverlandense]
METQPKARLSGIPRPVSRLPLPTASSIPIRPSPSRERLRADPGIDDRRLRRPSRESLRSKTLPRYSPVKSTENALPEHNEPFNEVADELQLETQTSEEVERTADDEEVGTAQEDRGRREERPSLSERTIGTLSNISPSPASVKRQSSFFNGVSPMRSPSRTPSNVSNYSQSPSRSSSGQHHNGSETFPGPVSKLRLPSNSRVSTPSSLWTSDTHDIAEASESPSKLRFPPAKQTGTDTAASEISAPLRKPVAIPGRSSVYGGNKDVSATASPARFIPKKITKKPSQTDMGPPDRPLTVRKTRKPQADSPSTMRSPSTASRYFSTASSMPEELDPEQQAEAEARKATKSSNALRESIAKAKAAKKAATAKKMNTPKAEAADPWASTDAGDPFNQLTKESNPGVLRKRVETARATGQLNIAALSLTEIPKEVLDMYKFDPNASSNWFENVDLSKFIAADNGFTEISDETFPDIDMEDFDPESNERGPQFGGIETLDLHGNVLQTLPMGLRRLQQLRSLNLSNNSLSIENIQVVVEIPSLVDLKLANNQLQGRFPSDIGRLRSLETLDLHCNKLTELPHELGELTSLKSLDVGENQLTYLPFEELSKLPLKTINAPKNRLAGTLIPASVDRLETLQSLNIANNLVDIFSANEMLSCPSLHSLFMGINRIKRLPCVSSWQSLLTLSAEDNKIAELPVGFPELRSIKTVDLTGNDISRLDEKIGFMESLTSFRIGNNPLRERRLLSMDTEQLRQDMRSRYEPDPQDTDDEGSVATQFTLAPETPSLDNGWRIRPGGVLDRSYSELTDLETEKLELIALEDVRSLYLQHNDLHCFPVPALGMLAKGLIELDISHNPLDSRDLIPTTIELPKLQTLNLSVSRLSSLESLLSRLIAPSLSVLDISNNRLTGPLPHLRSVFPALKTILASDNQLSRLDFEVVQGLQVLDVSNNDIDYLPPKIGLLSAERSPRNWGDNGSALRRFEVAGNRFRVPRWQVVAKGTDAVLEFLKDRIPAGDLPEWEENVAAADEF